jgi:gluconolactonase
MSAIDMTMINQKIGLEKLDFIAGGVDHAEGLTVTPDGTLYAGGEAGQVYRFEGDQAIIVADSKGFMLGLTSDAENRVYAIDNFHKCIWRYDPKTEDFSKWLTGPANKPLNIPNWGSFGPDGSYYLTDSGDWEKSDGLIWVKRRGEDIKIFHEGAKHFPNGCVVSRDGKKLYYVESIPSSICEIDINPDGTAGERRSIFNLGLLVPDGIKEADDGALIVSFYSPNLIARWSKADGFKVLASDPQAFFLAAPTNFDFMGPNRDTMVFASLARWNLSRGNLGIKGAPAHFPTKAQIGN